VRTARLTRGIQACRVSVERGPRLSGSQLSQQIERLSDLAAPPRPHAASVQSTAADQIPRSTRASADTPDQPSRTEDDPDQKFCIAQRYEWISSRSSTLALLSITGPSCRGDAATGSNSSARSLTASRWAANAATNSCVRSIGSVTS
jgi:hypothetical protein